MKHVQYIQSINHNNSQTLKTEKATSITELFEQCINAFNMKTRLFALIVNENCTTQTDLLLSNHFVSNNRYRGFKDKSIAPRLVVELMFL